jgi:hypothetical protein
MTLPEVAISASCFKVDCGYCGPRDYAHLQPMETSLSGKTVTTRVHCWTCDHDTIVTMSFGGLVEMATRSGFRSSKGRLY